jgi:hypothetical protein
MSWSGQAVTPISLRIWYCQYCPSPKDTTIRTAALMKKTSQDRRSGRRGSRSAKARQIHANSTPSPYPMAAVMPQTRP